MDFLDGGFGVCWFSLFESPGYMCNRFIWDDCFRKSTQRRQSQMIAWSC